VQVVKNDRCEPNPQAEAGVEPGRSSLLFDGSPPTYTNRKKLPARLELPWVGGEFSAFGFIRGIALTSDVA
jgi:hypothetical protein